MKADPKREMPAYSEVLEMPFSINAKNMAIISGAPDEHIEYMEHRTYCANLGCVGQGLKACARCKRVRYCGVECQRAHWPQHKPDCSKPTPKAVSKEEKKTGKPGKGSIHATEGRTPAP